MAARRRGFSFDASTLAEAFRRPGQDPRQWISYGVVDQRTQDEDGSDVDAVFFDKELGPLVRVTLQPTNIPVVCRVGMQAAGNGEAEYHPFIAGDEVLVAIPEGNERAAPVIFSRLCNGIDLFPENVAGQDPTKNTFGFRRRRTPFVEEFASTWMIRVASHGGFALLSEAGTWTLRDGSGGALQMGPDIFGFSEGSRTKTDPNVPGIPPPVKALLQYDLTGRRIIFQMDDAQFMLNSSTSDAQKGNAFLSVPAQLTVALGNNKPQEHVATVEFVLATLQVALASIAAGFGFPAIAAVSAAIAAGGAPLGAFAAPLAAGLPIAGARPKPAVPGIGVQLAPGLGAVFFKTG